MFGVFPIAAPQFGDAINAARAPARTYRTQIAIPCAVKTCDEDSDFSLYSLETAAAATPLEICPVKECLNETSDLTIYNLQDALYFNGTPLSVLVGCPPGYYCPPGVFPHVFTYPPGTFTVNIPPIINGFPTVLSIHGCEHDLNTVLPSTATTAQIQAAANQLIAEAAEQQARCDALTLVGPALPIAISLSAIDAYACVDVPFAATVFASSSPSRTPFLLALSGAPAWMLDIVNASGTQMDITGTPTTIGPVSFTIGASGSGASGLRNYTLNIVGIATASPLPDGEVGNAYSQTLDASSIPGVLTWSIAAGSLPAGLSLDSATGEISGTPTTEETATFTVGVTNGTISCSKEFELDVAAASECQVFEGLVWPAPTTTILGSGTASGTPSGNVITVSTSAGAWAAGVNKGFIFYNTGSVNYTGPGGNCCVDLTIAVSGNPTQNVWNIIIKQGAATLLSLVTGDTSGSYPFTLNPGVADVLTVLVGLDSQSDALNPDAKSINITAVIGGC